MLSCHRHRALVIALVALAAPAHASTPRRAALGTRLPLGAAAAPVTALADSNFACFEAAALLPAINPGCFVTFDPRQEGDCSAHASHYLLQALLPALEVPRRVHGFSFRSNDGDTVFPAAGILLVPIDATGAIALPGPRELATLQVGQVPSVADTSWVYVDLRGSDLVVPAGAKTAVLVVLRFPEGGRLVAVGDGPGIEVDAVLPDQDCDFFSIDTGATWYAPAYDPADPLAAPLDWGFVLHWGPPTALSSMPWSALKSLYRTP